MAASMVGAGERAAADRRALSLAWKITAVTAATLVVTGLFIFAVLHRLVTGVLTEEAALRARGMAVGVSVAVDRVARKDRLELQSLLAAHARLDRVAYVLLEDGRGKLLAHAPEGSREELQALLSENGDRPERFVTVQGKPVLETRAPSLAGQGAVRVGLWFDSVEAERRRILFPVVVAILVVLAFSVSLSALLVRRVTAPILSLRRVVERMSQGDFDSPARDISSDKLGNLPDSLERMRASLKAALARLDREGS
jgi:methyl-accepting chemotaxis protein